MFLTLIFLFIFSSSISDDYLPFFLIVGLIFILIEAYYFIRSKSQRKNNVYVKKDIIKGAETISKVHTSMCGTVTDKVNKLY